MHDATDHKKSKNKGEKSLFLAGEKRPARRIFFVRHEKDSIKTVDASAGWREA
ncbi:MAG: hypothetical protein LV479_01680 [Methylacidiphilales bacterium]|nr:hypothetical protein [Candidatus Methylacidiphilales bacterium]